MCVTTKARKMAKTDSPLCIMLHLTTAGSVSTKRPTMTSSSKEALKTSGIFVYCLNWVKRLRARLRPGLLPFWGCRFGERSKNKHKKIKKMIRRKITKSSKRKRTRTRTKPSRSRNLHVTPFIAHASKMKTFSKTTIWPNGSNSLRKNGTPFWITSTANLRTKLTLYP